MKRTRTNHNLIFLLRRQRKCNFSCLQLSGTGRKLLTNQPDERTRLGRAVYGIKNNEHLKTRIRKVRPDMVLEVRKDDTERWSIRKIVISRTRNLPHKPNKCLRNQSRTKGEGWSTGN